MNLELFVNKNNITYDNLVDVDTTANNKPKESWMKEYSIDKRKEKFFEFCNKFDKREDDLLKYDYQIFSHRLHWNEHPFCYTLKDLDDNFKKILYTLIFSFTNEHWLTFKTLHDKGLDGLKERFKTERPCRSDLFQIYYPKGTIVKDWLLVGPLKCATEMKQVLDNKDRRWTMMELAKTFSEYFEKEQGFRSAKYPCKNFARYMAMTWPDQVDPDSILFGGTGHFDGLHQIYGGVNLNGRVKYDINNDGDFVPQNKYAEEWIDQMFDLINDERNPIVRHQLLNIEDKTCFFYKHIAINKGMKRPTNRIPYNWIFPKEFKLAT